MLDELIAPLGIPAIANVPVGHGKHMATMPLGATVRLDGDAQDLGGDSRRRSSRADDETKGRRDEASELWMTAASLLAATAAVALALGRQRRAAPSDATTARAARCSESAGRRTRTR